MDSSLRPFHKDLCVLLNTSSETLLCLACSLFGAGVIDKINKTAIITKKGLEGADQLLNLVHSYLEGGDATNHRLDVVLGLFEAEELLRDVTRKIKEQESTSSGSSDAKRESSATPHQDQVISSPVLSTGQLQHQYVYSAPAVNQALGLPLFPSHAIESDAFTEELAQEPRWYTLGVLLGIPTHKLEAISANYGTVGTKECLAELYKCSIELKGEVSWEQIVDVLRKMDNTCLANSLYSKYIAPSLQSSPLSESEDSVRNNSKKVEVPIELVQEFEKLSLGFHKLTIGIRHSIKQSHICLDDLQDLIREECSLEPLSGKQATVDCVLKRLTQHYCLLNVRILKFVVETFLGEENPLQGQLMAYIELVDKFKTSAKMRYLVDLLKEHQTTSNGCKLVKLKVREFWSRVTVKKFEKMLREILQTVYDYASHMTVAKGCICVSWVIPDVDTTKLITLQPLEFLKIIGVVSLHIGDSVVYDIPGEGCDTLEAAMLQAVELKNTRAVELLLAAGCDPEVATKNGDNAVTNIVNIRDSNGTLGTMENVCVFGHNKKIEEIMSKSDPDDCSLRKCLPEDVPMETDVVEKRDSEPEETIDSLRLKVEDLEEQKNKLTEGLKQIKEAELEDVPSFYRKIKAGDKYEPPEHGFTLVGEVSRAHLTISNPILESPDHGIKIQIDEDYWSQDPSAVLQCCLAAGLGNAFKCPSGYISISPVCFLSCKTDRPIEFLFTMPHALVVTPSEDHLKRISIFSVPNSGLSLSSGLFPYSYSSQKFTPVTTADLTMDDQNAKFSTALYEPSLFVVGFAISTGGVSPTVLPVIPLQCCLYVEYPVDVDEYLSGTEINVYITLNMRTIETAGMKQQGNTKLEKKEFILSESEVTVNGMVENSPSDWVALREGNGLHQYTKIAYGHHSTMFVVASRKKYHDPLLNHTVFVVQCYNSKEPLKFIVSVVGEDYELVEMVITPSTLSKEDEAAKLTEESARPPHSEKTLDLELQNAMESGVHTDEASEAAADVSPDLLLVTTSQEPERVQKDKQQSIDLSSARDYESIMTYSTASRAHLTRKFPSLISEDNDDTKIEISKNYWSQYPSDVVLCQLAVPHAVGCVCPSGYIFISQPTYLSCETKQPVEIHVTMPHVLATSSENHSLRVVIFSSTISKQDQDRLPGTTLCSLQQFSPMQISDLTMDDHNVLFTTTVSEPSLFAVGFAISTGGMAPTPLPVVPLQCLMSVGYSSNLDDYLSGTDISVRISMDLNDKMKQQPIMLTQLRYMGIKEEQQKFILPGPVLSVKGVLENSPSDGWQSVRRGGKGSYRYDEIAISEHSNRKWFNYPPNVQTTFFVKCFNPKEPLKFRVTVLCHNNNELVNMLLPPVKLTKGTETQSGGLSVKDTTNSNLFSPSGIETQSGGLSVKDTTNTET